MGIFDFLGDLSSKRSKELGLGGLQSLLGTRGAAKAGDTGDEMMKITGGDSLPGYYNQETREYVPWYVDLFDGGGLNAAGGAASAEAAGMPAAGAGLLGPNVQPGPALGSQLSDMERLNRMPGVQAQAGPAIGTTIEQPLVDMQNRASINKQPSVQEIMSQTDDDMSGYYPGGMPSMPGMDAPLAPQSFLGGAIDAPAAGFPTAGENSFLDRFFPNARSRLDAVLSGKLAESNRAKLNGNASTSNPSLPRSQSVDSTEFERFKSKFEKELKANGLWGFPNKIQETFDGLKSRGLNY